MKPGSDPDERDIARYLRDELAADAAIIVGSRADGTARPGSDWDCYVLIDDGSGPRGPRAEPRTLGGASLDIGVAHLPVAKGDVLAIFGPNLEPARVLFDTKDGAAARLVETAAAVYAAGKHLTQAEISTRAHQLRRNIETMQARQDDPGPFFEALTFVFYVSHRHWYEVLHGRFSKSVHRAMPQIEREDPDFHQSLVVLTSAEPASAKLRAARDLYRRLFGDVGAL